MRDKGILISILVASIPLLFVFILIGVAGIFSICLLGFIVNTFKKNIVQIGLEPIQQKLLQLLFRTRISSLDQLVLIFEDTMSPFVYSLIEKAGLSEELQELCQKAKIPSWRIRFIT